VAHHLRLVKNSQDLCTVFINLCNNWGANYVSCAPKYKNFFFISKGNSLVVIFAKLWNKKKKVIFI
jgi:hypothetical protein